MPEWSKVGIDVVAGGAAGAVDQLVQNWDERRALADRASGNLAVNAKLPLMKQYGTYLNYGVPILAILATVMGWVRGDMETRLITIGSQLAGRKVTHQFTTGATSSTPSAAYTQWERARAQAILREQTQGAERSRQPEFIGARIL